VAPDQIRSVQVVRLYSSATLFPTPDQRLGRSLALFTTYHRHKFGAL
jgi:hypothetical protein